MNFQEAQQDMRQGYLSGVPGVAVSGTVWLVASALAATVSHRAGVYGLLVGGAAIFPLSVVLTKVLGRRGAHTPGNPLGILAMEGTFWMLAGIAVAYGVHALRVEWFFPIMLLVIGGRYLTFQTLYGMKAYWALGAALCAAGLLLGVAKVSPPLGAAVGGILELAFAALLLPKARKS